jgi:hypothetical protein
VKDIFEKYADKAQNMILPNRLQESLGELGVQITSEEAEELFTIVDIDENGGLDFGEFRQVIRQPFSQVEQFLNTLPLSGMLASCLVKQDSTEPLKDLCNIEHEKLKAVTRAFALSLEQVLREELDKLKGLVDAMEVKRLEDINGCGAKYRVFSMNAGSVKEYHEGIYSRIGVIATSSAKKKKKVFIFTLRKNVAVRCAA